MNSKRVSLLAAVTTLTLTACGDDAATMTGAAPMADGGDADADAQVVGDAATIDATDVGIADVTLPDVSVADVNALDVNAADAKPVDVDDAVSTTDGTTTPDAEGGADANVDSGEAASVSPADACSDACQTSPVAFRFTDLDVRDPHLFFNYIGCRDVTDTPLTGYSFNGALQTSIQTDSNLSGQLDYSPTLVFRSFDQSAATQPVELHFASCSAPLVSTACRPSGGTVIQTTATNSAAGQCLTAIAGTTHGYAPAITSSSAPCFTTSPFAVTLNLGGLSLSLTDARIGATYVGNPAGSLVNGLLIGFLPEATANNTIIPASFPLVGGQPLAMLLPGGDPPGPNNTNCAAFSDKDDYNGVPGWWFYFNFPAARVTWSEP